MDKGKALQTSFQKLNLNPNSNKSTSAHTIQSPILTVEKRKPVPTLVTLCIQVIGSHYALPDFSTARVISTPTHVTHPVYSVLKSNLAPSVPVGAPKVPGQRWFADWWLFFQED
ncbi:hypothetical protein DCAR_0934290 [Daucus carota subsp. sativus]|uniref:Uncharacterized protein n=1 Tax=Daucus carota subsp. sativus TaxID=79200 RepID=A0A166FSG6_DAUCS|nr:hypothetical protein DCAR_0934290 [Daucus carota subsp. sativus]